MEQPKSTPQARRINKACDACKLRKVRCNGETKCQQCSHLNLRCVYSAPKPRQKSLKRGQLIAQYKQNTTKPAENASFLESQCLPSPVTQQFQTQTLPAISTLLSESPQSTDESPNSTPSQDASFYSSFLPDYEKSVYPVNPIISVPEVQASIGEMDSSREARAFVYVFVAVTVHLTHCEPELEAETLAQVSYWVTETIRTREPMMLNRKVTVRNNMTSQFLHICFMGLKDIDMAFFYLRESITMIQIQRIDQPSVMKALPLSERARLQRLYSEASIHERFLAVVDYRPIVLPQLPHLPEDDPDLPRAIRDGWTQIIKMHSLIDGEFLDNWFSTNSDNTPVTLDWIEDKHRQIDAELAEGNDQLSHLSNMQQADLIITKQWLRTLVWQMAISKCYLSSSASKESMSLLFPVRLSAKLRSLVTHSTREAIAIHGSGIQQKLCEVCDTIANVIMTVPAATVEETAGRVDDFMFLINFLFSLPRFGGQQRDLLQNKLEKLQTMFPYSANTPDSMTSLPMGTVQTSPVAEDDPWLSVVLKTVPGRSVFDIIDPALRSQGLPSHGMQPPARVYQDMTRRLSLAPYSAIGS